MKTVSGIYQFQSVFSELFTGYTCTRRGNRSMTVNYIIVLREPSDLFNSLDICLTKRRTSPRNMKNLTAELFVIIVHRKSYYICSYVHCMTFINQSFYKLTEENHCHADCRCVEDSHYTLLAGTPT